jgi:hypothetical protein
MKQMESLIALSSECHQFIKVNFLLMLLKRISPNFLNYCSTIVSAPRSNTTTPNTPGGTTGTAMRNTFGQEIKRTKFTPASVELIKTVLILR